MPLFEYPPEFSRDAMNLYGHKPHVEELLKINSLALGAHIRPDAAAISPDEVLLALANSGEQEDEVLARLSSLVRQRELFGRWQEMARGFLKSMDPESSFFQ